MNGISLLVALAAVGIDVGWEAANDGQLRYTIRIEKGLLDPLREGQAIVSPVEAKDKGLVNFQIVVDKAGSGDRRPPQQETMVEHGWRPGENGGVDYLIQISPERLETLASGTPIWSQISPEVTDIRRFYVFAGVGQLPRQSPEPSQKAAPEPPEFIRDDGSATPASAARNSNDGRVTQGSSRYGGSQYPSSTDRNDSYDRVTSDAGRNGYDTRTPSDGDWRNFNDRDRATWSTDRNSYPAREPNNGSRFSDGNGYPSSGGNSGGNSGRYDDRYAAAPQRGPAGADYRQSTPPPAQRQDAYPNQQQQQQQPIAAPVQPVAAAAPAQTYPTSLVAQQTPTLPFSPTAAAPQTRVAEDEVRPWTPLILTTLALFASMGANAYLGWLAWSFFWRYRDAASDVVRARQSSTRQAA